MSLKRCAVSLLVLASLAGAAAPGQPPAAEGRKEAMASAAAALEAEVKAHGGSWAEWIASLEPFRADVRQTIQGKWPWPSKKNFRFLGKAIKLLLTDTPEQMAPQDRPFEAIVHLDRQLKARGIDLIVAPIPDKVSIYPDYLSDKAPADRQVAVAVKRLMADLLAADVEVIDLHTPLLELRRELGEDKPLYYDQDSHWRNRASAHAGKLIAERFKRYEFVQKASSPYTTRAHERTDGAKADSVEIVVFKDTGRRYDDVDGSPAILTGDSFSMYNMHLGGHLPAQVALHTGVPMTYLCREGLSMDMPVELARRARDPKFLEGRKVIVWTFCSRSFVAGKWAKVDLPGGAVARQPRLEAQAARATVSDLSQRPATDADYPNFIMKLQVKDLKTPDGRAIGDGRAVLYILAMKDRTLLPAARIDKGQALTLRLTDWESVRAAWGKTHAGTLDDDTAERDWPVYWVELAE